MDNPYQALEWAVSRPRHEWPKLDSMSPSSRNATSQADGAVYFSMTATYETLNI